MSIGRADECDLDGEPVANTRCIHLVVLIAELRAAVMMRYDGASLLKLL